MSSTHKNYDIEFLFKIISEVETVFDSPPAEGSSAYFVQTDLSCPQRFKQIHSTVFPKKTTEILPPTQEHHL